MRYELNDNNDNNVETRLTGYALGELEDVDRAEVEIHLQRDAGARAEVEAIRQVAGIVTRELHCEPAANLSIAQRETIEARAGRLPAPTIHRFPHRRVWSYVGLTALAASIALMFIVPLWIDPDGPETDDRFAIGDDETGANGMDSRESAESLASTAPADENRRDQNEIAMRQENQSDEALGEGELVDEILEQELAAMEMPPAVRERQDEGTHARMSGQDALDSATAPSDSPEPSLPPASVNGQPAPGSPGGGGGGGFGGGALRGGCDGGMEGGDIFAEGERGLAIEERENVVAQDPARARLAETQFAAPTGIKDSTFSIDVDTASYSIIRRSIQGGSLPHPDAVRIEEMLNYFTYNDPPPTADDPHPFASYIEIATCPWNPQHRLARVSLKGRAIDMANRVGSNLVFLVDVSASMDERDRLPLVKECLKLLVNELSEDDRISIVVYAGQAGVALEPTAASPAKKTRIIEVIDSLRPGGSTHGSAGIQTAYDLAMQNFIEGGLNRVILATDGDFNVGISDTDTLREFIEEKRETGIYLSTLGFGTGNLQDHKLEQLADHGNGNYAYIDSLEEGQRVLVKQIEGTLFTIAENVKVQIDFNPDQVGAYRLIGYENRMLEARDFRDDTKDAGEIGAGHGVTALYEIIPPHLVAGDLAMDRTREANQPALGGGARPGGGGAGSGEAQPERETDALDEVNEPAAEGEAAEKAREIEDFDGNIMRLKLRYRVPGGEEMREFSSLAADSRESFESASADFQFAAAVATLGLVLRDSQFKGDASFTLAEELALPGAAPHNDPAGYRAQFLELFRRAKEIAAE